MGLTVIRKDSIKDRRQKTRAELQRENEVLQEKVTLLEEQIDNTNLALCDVYEQILGGESLG